MERLRTVLWFVPVTTCFNDLCYGLAKVQGGSMQPTLSGNDCNGEVVLVEKWGVRLGRYTRGDVVMIRSPTEPRQVLIKRLLALEGDWVCVPGRVEIEKIPKGHCWVEGDNFSRSEDSHSKFGSVPVALVEGRVPCVIWPLHRAQKVHCHLPRGRLLVKNDGAFRDDEMF